LSGFNHARQVYRRSLGKIPGSLPWWIASLNVTVIRAHTTRCSARISFIGKRVMSEELRARIYDLYKAYGEGRLDFVLESFSDQAKFISYAPVDVFPYLGVQHGKIAIAEMMKKAHAQFEFLTYQPIFMVVENNDAGTIVMARLRQRTTDRIIALLVAHFIRFQDGRIVECREFMDSFDAVQQVLGHHIDTSKL
jgi:ketosteroid isomerase-like protein